MEVNIVNSDGTPVGNPSNFCRAISIEPIKISGTISEDVYDLTYTLSDGRSFRVYSKYLIGPPKEYWVSRGIESEVVRVTDLNRNQEYSVDSDKYMELVEEYGEGAEMVLIGKMFYSTSRDHTTYLKK